MEWIGKLLLNKQQCKVGNGFNWIYSYKKKTPKKQTPHNHQNTATAMRKYRETHWTAVPAKTVQLYSAVPANPSNSTYDQRCVLFMPEKNTWQRFQDWDGKHVTVLLQHGYWDKNYLLTNLLDNIKGWRLWSASIICGDWMIQWIDVGESWEAAKLMKNWSCKTDEKLEPPNWWKIGALKTMKNWIT